MNARVPPAGLSPEVVYSGWHEDGMIPWFLLPKPAEMHVPEKIRRCVIFLGSKNERGVFIPRATAFLATSHSKGDDEGFPHIITAEHVISAMQSKGLEIYARLNLKPEWAERSGEGAAVVSIEGKVDWYFHPDVGTSDVAVGTVGINLDIADHDFMPLFEYTWTEVDANFQPQPPSWGDEVFIVGLFRSHFGRQRNRPIVRIGNISALPEEPVKTDYAGYIDAYLIEARSIAGLSGSPVFATHNERPMFHVIADPRFAPNPDDVQWPRYHFLGLMHGHFDLESLTEDSVVEDAAASRGINSGIGLVIPASKVLETLYQPELKALRAKRMKQSGEKKGPTPDVDLSDQLAPPASDENPTHREDFTRPLSAASQTHKSED